MRITGSHTIAAPRQEVWDALHDPAVLARTLPGCNELVEVRDDCYDAVLTAGVASIRGTYEGRVELTGKDAPQAYTLTASGSGAPGTISADARVELSETDDGTQVAYDADAIVGGMLGGVGQRMIVSVARRTAGEFFDAVERDLVQGPPEPAEVEPEREPEPTAAGAGAPAEAPRAGAPAEAPRVFAGTAPPASSASDAAPLLLAAALGAVVALAGVLVGRRLAS